MAFEQETDRSGGHSVSSIHQQLRDAILLGQLAPGEVRSQVALSEEMGVGRTPVREALRLLQNEGLVASEANRRVRISDLTGSDAEQLYVLRIPMEVTAVRLTVPSLSFDDLAEMEGFMAQMDHYGRGRDWVGLRVPHSGFHTKLIEGAGARIVNEIKVLADHAERYRVSKAASPVDPTIEDFATRQAEHRGIADAATAHDVEATAELLARHYARTAGTVLSRIEPGREPDRLRLTLEHTVPAAIPPLDAALEPGA